MTLKTRTQWIEWGRKELERAGTQQPLAEAEFLLAASLKTSRTRVLAFSSEPVPQKEAETFCFFIDQKRQGLPVSYITGETDFCTLTLRSDQRALAPRPETEELVEYCAKLFEKGANPRILDLCTGSGCIALALAAKFPRAHVTAVDISAEALSLAAENARLCKLQDKVCFLQSDLFAEVNGSFDLIVSNPPYIPTSQLEELSIEVQQEPRLALDGGEDGLAVIGQIARLAADYLNPHGVLALEIGQGEVDAVCSLFDSSKWEGGIKKDFAGIDRFVFARRKF
ncbi:MAG: peptide chain release factor N(5)-glutamine methyltransferase [Elusimicrobiaceae bacterium]|nr:peptide chain release factor N(5)-glutamine methyltransferase [Elusimicrobiaceae bacterium]